jgi:hypothetical protein
LEQAQLVKENPRESAIGIREKTARPIRQGARNTNAIF